MKLMIIGALLVAVVSSCAAKINARDDREASKTVYEECLAQHLQDVSACEGARQAYEADLAIYRAISAGARPGANITVEQSTGPGRPSNPMPVIIGPNGKLYPCFVLGPPALTVCN